LSSLTGLDFAVGKVVSQYSNDSDSKSDTEWALKFGLDEFPVYFFAGYEEPNTYMLGQNIATNEIMSIGLGAKHNFSDKLRGFIEVGYADVDNNYYEETLQEVAYSYLIGRHASVGTNHLGEPTDRKVPVAGGPYDDYDVNYELDNGWISRIGVGYNLHHNLMVTASYKWMVLDEYISLKDPVIEKGGAGGWWEESNTRDFNAFEIGLFLTY
jgi:hypothetical protein